MPVQFEDVFAGKALTIGQVRIFRALQEGLLSWQSTRGCMRKQD